MSQTTTRKHRLSKTVVAIPEKPWVLRWYGRVALLLASTVLLTLAFAPIGQFYLAWVGLVPWLFVVHTVKSQKAAFFWSWLGGFFFFIANMWWLAYVTMPGMLGLMLYLSLYWGLAALMIRGTGLLELGTHRPWRRAVAGVLFTSSIWAGLEFVRGNLMTGLPWLYLGHTQSPVLIMCQIADALGVYGVSFWVVAVNVLVALLLFHRSRAVSMIPAAAIVVMLLLLTLVYGGVRRSETARTTSPGPVVTVIQPNYPQDNSSGEKGATEDERMEFHIAETARAVRAAGRVDLVAWSETMLPALNPDLRDFVPGTRKMPDWFASIDPDSQSRVTQNTQNLLRDVTDLSATLKTNILTGALTWGSLKRDKKNHLLLAESRNTALLFEVRPGLTPQAGLSSLRYDKIHCVPFGEFIPFRKTLPWLYNFFLKLSPYDFDYTITPGDDNALTVFSIPCDKTSGAVRIIAPICFEDIDSRLVSRLMRGNGTKRADLLVNLTNDGWFKANENSQHEQAALFRSIENRVPTARTVNTGISGFIDSYGRVLKTVPVQTTGTATMQVSLDSRVTYYTRFGDFFAVLCLLATGSLLVAKVVTGRRRRLTA